MGRHSNTNKGALTFHSIFLSLLLLGGAGFLGVGLWLQLAKNGGPVNLEWTGSGIIDSFLTLGVAAMVVGGLLLATSVFALCAVSRSCVGTLARVLFVMATLVVTAALVLLATVTLLIASSNRPDAVGTIVRDSWERTVTAPDPSVVAHACAIQAEFGCAGVDGGDCEGCVDGVTASGGACTEAQRARCPVCPTLSAPSSRGCYDAILERTRKVFLPVGITAAVVAGVALIDVFVVCCI